MNRFAVVGAPGVGKTTLAEHIANKRKIPSVDLDAYFWGPGWVQTPRSIFYERVAQTLTGNAWTTSGNYRVARPIVWARADTLVWLDYTLCVVLWRMFRRSLRRIRTQEELWNGNRESWRLQFFSRDSLFLNLFLSHRERCRELPIALGSPDYAHLEVFHFKHSRETAEWLKNL